MKIGRWAQPYSEPGNPYPDETDSIKALPLSCPINNLPYGLLTEMILPLIKVKRREEREKRIDFLIKKTLKVNLIQCFEEIYRLSMLDHKNSLIPKLRRTYELHNKQNMRQLVADCEIPTIYLEEMYQKQLHGPPKLEVGDWVKSHDRGSGWIGRGDTWGVIKKIIGKNDVEVSLVKRRFCKSTNYQGQPLFHRWERSYETKQIVKKKISKWKCEKVGHDTLEWKKLRSKLISDYNTNGMKRNYIWQNKLLPIIEQLQEGSISSDQSWIIKRICSKIWFTMGINLLDKNVWENKPEHTYLLKEHLFWCRRRNVGHVMDDPTAPAMVFKYLRNIVLRDGILD